MRGGEREREGERSGETKREAGKVWEERMDGGMEGSRGTGENIAKSMQKRSIKCRDSGTV